MLNFLNLKRGRLLPWLENRGFSFDIVDFRWIYIIFLSTGFFKTFSLLSRNRFLVLIQTNTQTTGKGYF